MIRKTGVLSLPLSFHFPSPPPPPISASPLFYPTLRRHHRHSSHNRRRNRSSPHFKSLYRPATPSLTSLRPRSKPSAANAQCQKILDAKSNIHRMHLAAIWSGNFQHLRNTLGCSCNVKLLRTYSGVYTGKSVDARRLDLRTLTARVEGRDQNSQSSKPCNINLNLSDETVRSSKYINSSKSELHQLKPFQNYTLQQKISDNNKVFERPATVIVIDIETTGFSREKDRIIEIALRDLIGGENSTFETLVNPERYVPKDSVHGISNHMVNRPDVPKFKELIPFLLEYVSSRRMDGKPVMLCAHNARTFDVPFIMKEFQRCSMEVPDDWLFLDTLLLARKLVMPDGSKLPSSRLKVLREHYNIPLVGPEHRAMQDVIALSYILQRITFDLKLTVPELLKSAFRASELIKVPTGGQTKDK